MTLTTRALIDFRTTPSEYRHWKIDVDGRIATLTMDVSEAEGLLGDYTLKLNSYDLGVDIELFDAVQRLRFEHPGVGAVIIAGGKEKIFCAGANIGMLAMCDHAHKVNFCKFTNETRLAIEDASANSGQVYLSAVGGTAAGGGYELALATEYIVLVDDGSAAVGLPEVPLLGVLPGTGGLTRVLEKRRVRRDLADVFATRSQGVKGRQALEWGLVDEIVARSRLTDVVEERAREFVTRSDRPKGITGTTLDTITREITGDSIRYSHVDAVIDRSLRTVTITINGPEEAPEDLESIHRLGSAFWPLAVAREFDDLVLHLRFNEPEIGTFVLKAVGSASDIAAVDGALIRFSGDWFVREVILNLKRTLKRLDMTARSVIALVEGDSCFVGSLAELLFAADRAYMQEDASITLTGMNFGPLPMGHGITRLEARYGSTSEVLSELREKQNETLDAEAAAESGVVTALVDELDWDDEIRILLEERASFSPDALTGLEANLRFPGPETMETKIFGRLTAWQNWVFSRPNATGEDGALKRYGTGERPTFDLGRT